jgi:hypothetical protein
MTKHTTNSNDDAQLDVQIKELLGRAVALTPQPPDLEHPMLTKVTPLDPRKRNGWIIGSGIGLGAAAAITGLVIIPNLDNTETIQTPAESVLPTVPEVEATLPVTVVNPPTTSDSPRPSTASSVPVVVDPDTATDDTGAATGDPDPVVDESIVISAGTDGIRNGETVLSDAPTIVALNGPGGKIWHMPRGDDAGIPQVLDPATGEVMGIEVPTDDGHEIELLDVATVQGNVTLLYTTRFPTCNGGGDPACVTTLRTFQPDTGEGQIIAEQIAWEAGWGPYQLADNGLIFGNNEGIISAAPDFYNISTGPTPSLEALGLAQLEGDCSDCPRTFTIDRAGAHTAWFDGGVDDQRIVLTTLATGERVEVRVAGATAEVFRSQLQIADVEIVDGVVVSGQAILSPSDQDGERPDPVAIDLTTGAVTTLESGTVVTIN